MGLRTGLITLFSVLCFCLSQAQDTTIVSGSVYTSFKTDTLTNDLVLILSSDSDEVITLSMYNPVKWGIYWYKLVYECFPYYKYQVRVGSQYRNHIVCTLNTKEVYRVGIEYDRCVYQYVLFYKQGWKIKTYKL